MKAISSTNDRLLHCSRLMATACATVCLAGVLPRTASAQIAGQLGILDLNANGGLNPSTGQPWAAGDQYRLIFHSSVGRTAETDNIWDYNDWAQGLADASTAYAIGADDGAKWRVVGSTNTFDARDNLWTNPEVDGDGHPVFLLDGSTLVAIDFMDLWDGEVANIIDQTEAGTTWAFWPFTGTYFDGTTAYGKPDSNFGLGGGPQINQGQAGVASNWVWRTWTGDPPATVLPMYAMSMPLTVVDLTDAVPPNYVSTTDDAGGLPVAVGQRIKYTVAFDEPLAAGRVNADDFENATATAVTIERAIPTKDPNVFEVWVTPDAGGTVQLQLKAGATLTDLNDNALNTTSAFTDDTVITVISPNTFTQWIAAVPGLGGLDGLNDDPDGDGTKNGLENYFRTHPGEFNQGLVGLEVVSSILTFSHPVNEMPPEDLTVTYQWSEDLQTFHNDGVPNINGTSVSFTQGTPSNGMVEVTATIDGLLPEKVFVAIDVTQSP